MTTKCLRRLVNQMLPTFRNQWPCGLKHVKSWSYFSSYKLLIFQEKKIFSKHRSFLKKLQLPFLAQYLTEMFKCLYCTRKNMSSILCVREKRMKKTTGEKTLNCVPFTWFKYIVSVSLINRSKKVNFRTAQKYKSLEFYKIYSTPIRAQSFNSGVIIRGRS